MDKFLNMFSNKTKPKPKEPEIKTQNKTKESPQPKETPAATEQSIPLKDSSTVKSLEINQVKELVSSADIKKSEGFYYLKYINNIKKLKPSNPILSEKEVQGISFDAESIDLLVNDLTLLFKDKSDKIDNVQYRIREEMQYTKEMIEVLNAKYCDAYFINNLEKPEKEEKVILDIQKLDNTINYLNSTIEGMLREVDQIEQVVNKLTSNQTTSV